ncbi:uncharacterized protein LOC123201295 [Mangifera indica]|uniref:uncharacterized protein LOC123201295 n=1 Tax=Mangifera indica TaxID=29780 RepID=UPI001CFA2068|nr:uncharacterized protein LOC123201295 [Mangifera indica]
MSIRSTVNSKGSCVLLVFFIFLNCFPGFVLAAPVTLDSIEIYTTHEWIPYSEPTVYFQCNGENKTILPDVKLADHMYSFKREESWQPLTDFSGNKCKRCGFYEEDTIKSDDVFDEWEFCPSDFMATKGKYTREKEKEFKATFLCPDCKSVASSASTPKGEERWNVGIIILIAVLASTALIVGGVAAYRYWQKKRREQEQARFLKLFEDRDDILDELGLDM